MQALDFLRAIRDEPDDDGPRLVFADWLEEQGDPRGEFLRAQVLRGRGVGPDGLARREQVLEDRHRGEWLGPLAAVARTIRFHRGLVRYEADAASFFAAGVHRHPALAWVDRLHLWQLTPGQLPVLLGCPHLCSLTFLDLRLNRVGDIGARALAHAPALGPLRWLDLGSNGIGDRGTAALAQSPVLTRLTALHLAGNEIGAAGAHYLATSVNLTGLATLDLSYNRLGETGTEALADSPHLAGLTSLYLSGNKVGRGALALARSPHLGRLRKLHLSGNGLNPETAAALCHRFGDGARC